MRLVPGGSTKLDPITSVLGIARYVTKELGINGHHERFILSTQFQSRREQYSKPLKATSRNKLK